MPGQIVRRGRDAWLVRVPKGKDASGKRLYHNKTIRGTRRDAQAYLTKVLREMDTGTFVETSQVPLHDFAKQWLETIVRLRVRPRTLADYEKILERHILPALGHRRLASLTAQDIQSVIASIAPSLSPRTVRYVHSVLHNMLEQAVRWRLLATNPASTQLVELPREQRREMRALTVAEAGLFLEAAQHDRWAALWTLLLSSGLRPGEALGLKWADIQNGRIHVQRSLHHSGKEWRFDEPKTSRARRVVSLPPSTLSILDKHRANQARARLRAGASWRDLDLVFPNRSGEPMEYRTIIRRHFRPICEAAGIEGLRPYDLRHSCATLLLAAGENIKVVSERLGHTSAVLTLDTYSHVLPDMQRIAAERLESLLFAKEVAAS